MAIATGHIRLAPDALAAFNDGIFAICVAESPHDFETLERFLSFLPHSDLRVRLAAELPAAKPAVRARLQKALSALPRSVADAAVRAYKLELSEAGDRGECEAAVKRVSRAMATDSRLSDAGIQTEIYLYEWRKGPMPYPTPGTACGLWGFQEAAHAALRQRAVPRF